MYLLSCINNCSLYFKIIHLFLAKISMFFKNDQKKVVNLDCLTRSKEHEQESFFYQLIAFITYNI